MPRSSVRRAGAAHEIVSLARARMTAEYSVYFAPEIPPKKEAAARRVHAPHLPASEPILVMYDATLFGGGDEGFVITAARLCWKNFLEHPRRIAWEEIDPSSVAATNDGVRVAGGHITVGGQIAAGAAGTIQELVARARRDGDPYRAHAEVAMTSAAGGSLTVARLVALARQHVGEVESVFYHPGIPPPKLQNARATHAAHLPEGEEIAVLYDDTLFGGAADGFVITPERLCWKNFTGEAESTPWSALAPGAVWPIRTVLRVGERRLEITSRSEIVEPVAALLVAIAAEARGEGAR